MEEDIERGRCLGCGSYGGVFVSDSDRKTAVKYFGEFDIEKGVEKNVEKRPIVEDSNALAEISMYGHLNGRGIAPELRFGRKDEKKKRSMVMGIDAYDMDLSYPVNRTSFFDVARQLLRHLIHWSKLGIVHADLKPSNFVASVVGDEKDDDDEEENETFARKELAKMITSDPSLLDFFVTEGTLLQPQKKVKKKRYDVRVIDWGIARKIDVENGLREDILNDSTLWYRDPHALFGQGSELLTRRADSIQRNEDVFKVDVWSMGVSLLHMFYTSLGRVTGWPFAKESVADVADNIFEVLGVENLHPDVSKRKVFGKEGLRYALPSSFDIEMDDSKYVQTKNISTFMEQTLRFWRSQGLVSDLETQVVCFYVPRKKERVERRLFFDLLDHMLQIKFKNRYSVFDIESHPFMSCDSSSSSSTGTRYTANRVLFPIREVIEEEGVCTRVFRILSHWLVEVWTVFRLSPKTLFAGLMMLNWYLASLYKEKAEFRAMGEEERKRLQLRGSAVFALASSLFDKYPAELRDWYNIMDKHYSKELVETATEDLIPFFVPTDLEEMIETHCYFFHVMRLYLDGKISFFPVTCPRAIRSVLRVCAAISYCNFENNFDSRRMERYVEDVSIFFSIIQGHVPPSHGCRIISQAEKLRNIKSSRFLVCVKKFISEAGDEKLERAMRLHLFGKEDE